MQRSEVAGCCSSFLGSMSLARATAAGSLGSLSLAAIARWILHSPLVVEEGFTNIYPPIPAGDFEGQTCYSISGERASVAIAAGAVGFCGGCIVGVSVCVFLVGGALYWQHTDRNRERNQRSHPHGHQRYHVIPSYRGTRGPCYVCACPRVVPAGRVKARAGPIFKRVTVSVPFSDQEGYELMQGEEPHSPSVDLLCVSSSLASSLTVADDQEFVFYPAYEGFVPHHQVLVGNAMENFPEMAVLGLGGSDMGGEDLRERVAQHAHVSPTPKRASAPQRPSLDPAVVSSARTAGIGEAETSSFAS
eukprot:2016496-Amphidinium_carterae.1